MRTELFTKMASELIPLLLDDRRETWLQFTGSSMKPLIFDGDRILIAPINSALSVGEIVLFRHRNRLIAHRIVRAVEVGRIYVTKGDWVLLPDRPVSADEIMAVIVGIERNGRFVSVASPAWKYFGRLIACFSFMVGRAAQIALAVKRFLLARRRW